MKTIKVLFLTILVVASFSLSAQVAVNTDGSPADGSSALDVQSTERGLLIPRLTQVQRENVSNPATGLLVYQIDGTQGFYYNMGTPSSPDWIGLSSTLITQIADADGDTKVQVEESPDEDTIRFDVAGTERMTITPSGNVGIGTKNPGTRLVTMDGSLMHVHIGTGLPGVTWGEPIIGLSRWSGIGDAYSSHVLTTWWDPALGGYGLSFQTTIGEHTIADWDKNGALLNRMVIGYNGKVGIGTVTPSNLFSVNGDADFTGDVGIGTSDPDASAQLEMSSTSGGFLPPRMTAIERDAIANPATGLIIYCIDCIEMQQFNGVSWTNMIGKAIKQPCGHSFVDPRDGQSYGTVQIGTQCWMSENLNTGTKINYPTNQLNNGVIEKYCYNNDSTKCDAYGGLYSWDEAMQYVTITRGICPDGWHIPTDDEWCTLENEVDSDTAYCSWVGFISTDAGGNLKETGTTHWDPPNDGATNSSGFTARAGGYLASGMFYYLKSSAMIWSSTEAGDYAWYRSMSKSDASTRRSKMFRPYTMSVRCIRD